MTQHEMLINIVASMVLTLTPSPFSPVKTTGVLREKFGYEIKLPILSEVIEDLMKKKEASPPDLILANDKLKMVIAIECKSDFGPRTIERLSKQVDFYSSDVFDEFAKSFVSKFEKSEIWIVTYRDQEKLGEKISHFIAKKKEEAESHRNMVVWEVEIKKTEEAIIRKVYGSHQDRDLDTHLEANKEIGTSLPQIELLIDSSLTYPQRVARIGRRILSFVVSKSLAAEERIVSISDFKEKWGDAIISDKELANCFRYLTRLIPEIGDYETRRRSIFLKPKPPLSKIKEKIEDLESMTDEDFKIMLSRKERPPSVMVSGRKKLKPFKGSLEPWLKKGAIAETPASFDVIKTPPDNMVHDIYFREQSGTANT
jgi:hypothetical protein